MTTQTEALRLALRAMEYAKLPEGIKPDTDKAIAACKEALSFGGVSVAQAGASVSRPAAHTTGETAAHLHPQGEPVAVRHDFDGYGWMYTDSGSGSSWLENGLKRFKDAQPLYTHPAPAPLSDEDIAEIVDREWGSAWDAKAFVPLVREIERHVRGV